MSRDGATNLEVVDGDEVGEERENVFDLEEVALREEVHGLLDIFVLLDDEASCNTSSDTQKRKRSLTTCKSYNTSHTDRS